MRHVPLFSMRTGMISFGRNIIGRVAARLGLRLGIFGTRQPWARVNQCALRLAWTLPPLIEWLNRRERRCSRLERIYSIRREMFGCWLPMTVIIKQYLLKVD